MNLILRKAESEIPEFGHRPLTEIDFYLECQKRKIEVVEYPLFNCDGMTLRVGSRLIIAIGSELKGRRRLEAMWHEFGHAFLHVPSVSVGAWFCGVKSLMTRKQEREVDDFVAVALGYVKTDRWCKMRNGGK